MAVTAGYSKKKLFYMWMFIDLKHKNKQESAVMQDFVFTQG